MTIKESDFKSDSTDNTSFFNFRRVITLSRTIFSFTNFNPRRFSFKLFFTSKTVPNHKSDYCEGTYRYLGDLV